VPFEHPDVRVIVDSMFLDGLLHPLAVQGAAVSIPEWAKVGIVQDPLALRNLVAEGIKGILQSLPTLESSYRDWANLSRRFGEVLARFHALDTVRAEGLKAAIAELQATTDERLRQWVTKHYADLPSLPVAKGPVMVHHVPRFLSMRRGAGEAKIALLVFDGLAVDQWVQIREALAKRAPKLGFEESACFAWLPTLTSVSRQALFSGLKPREFADTIESTSPEPTQWSRFWQDQGLRANEVMYRKGIKRTDQLAELGAAISAPSIRVAGIVVDTVDEIVHGAVLGKRGIAAQIESWCESGFVDQLFSLLLDKGFHVYLTADHGNVEAVGQGRPNQGVAPELRGERVRTYRSETLVAESAAANPNTYRLDVAGLPANFMTLFAGGRAAFMQQGEPAVVHGGISVEELLVPFVSEQYGERHNVKVATRAVIQTLVDWSVVRRQEDENRLIPIDKRTLSAAEPSLWLVESIVRATNKPVSLESINSNPLVFPFSFDLPLAYLVANSDTLELRMEGANQQIVDLRRSN
jgi:hypothetical protein